MEKNRKENFSLVGVQFLKRRVHWDNCALCLSAKNT